MPVARRSPAGYDQRMLILAIEQSSVLASVALLNDGRVLAAERWHCTWNRSQNVFDILPSLLKNASVRPENIDVFAAGTGPGSFSGSRVAVSVAQALALPGGKRAIGISSGEALARDIAFETNATTPLKFP